MSLQSKVNFFINQDTSFMDDLDDSQMGTNSNLKKVTAILWEGTGGAAPRNKKEELLTVCVGGGRRR
jgi:hypothetical protein